MSEKYVSTDFWYTFINSLNNDGVAFGRSELEMDEETQKIFLDYLKEKIEEGVTNGETKLPPGLHNYFWRFTEALLPKVQTLVEGILNIDPNNIAALLVQTLVKLADWENQHLSLSDINLDSIPNDPCMNLAIINEYEVKSPFRDFDDFNDQVIILNALENLYAWATQQEDDARYQEARSFYFLHWITPYTVYKNLKNESQSLKQHFDDTAKFEDKTRELEKYIVAIKKCRDLVPLERAAFWKHVDQPDERADLANQVSNNTDIWDACLKSLENRENAPTRRLTQSYQEHLLQYLKSRIQEGVLDGKATLPTDLHKHISDFPEVMHLELREIAEESLDIQPENGAAMKMLAILVWKGKSISSGESDRDLDLLEQAMILLPNETEICLYALKHFDENFDPLFRRTLTTLERLFERASQQDETELHRCMTKLYQDIGRTPCNIYRNFVKNSGANDELIAISISVCPHNNLCCRWDIGSDAVIRQSTRRTLS